MHASVRRLAAAALAASLTAPAALAESPPGLDEARKVATDLLLGGQYDEAIQAYREIVKHAGGDAQSHYDLASALAFLRFYIEALPPAEEAVRLAPDNVRNHEMLAIVYFHLRLDAKGFASTLRMAELGDAPAMYTLADFYETGRGVTPNPDKAVHWAERAAETGHIAAMELMERVHREGMYTQPIDLAKAEDWAKRREAALR